MATKYTNTHYNINTDQSIREVLTEFVMLWESTGVVVRVPVAGDIDLDTVTAPTTSNGAVGFLVFRMNDSLQNTAPVYIRFDIQRSSSAPQAGNADFGTLSFQPTVGTELLTNGAISGTSYTYPPSASTLAVSQVGGRRPQAFPSRACGVDGYAFVMFKDKITSNTYNTNGGTSSFFFMVGRTTDNQGVPNGEGLLVLFKHPVSPSPLRSVYLNFVTNTSISHPPNTTSYCSFIPFGLTNTSVGMTPQVFKIYMPTPKIRSTAWAFTYLVNESQEGAMFQAALYGNTARRYITMGAAATGCAYHSDNSASVGLCLLWE